VKAVWKTASFVLLLAGLTLIVAGVRERLFSIFGQSELAGAWQDHPSRRTDADRPRVHVGEAIALLRIPRLQAEMYVVEGTGIHELRRGPGHLPTSAFPGTNGNCVIAAHRDTHFRILKDIREGDEIILETRRGYFSYVVRATNIISPDETQVLRPTETAKLSLITCYPFYYVGPAPKRFVVTAELIQTMLPRRVS